MDTDKPIVVRPGQGALDGLQAAARYLTVIIGAVVALLGLLKTRDIAGFIAFVQNNGGEVFAAVAGLVSLGTAAYGVIKTALRGRQVAAVAADNRVPPNVAHLK